MHNFRTTVFSLHEELNISADQTAAVAGHSSKATQIIYKKNNLNTSRKVNSKLVNSLAGEDIVVPQDESYVQLIGGRLGRIKRFQTKAGELEEETPIIPIETMDLDSYYQHVPDDDSESNED